MKSPIQLVIPAAGAGSRFRITGVKDPKPLIKVGGIPMIMWVMSNFGLVSGDTVTIICQESESLPEKLHSFLSEKPYTVDFLEINGLTEGPAITVELAFHLLAKEIPIVVANSDQYVSASLGSFISSIRNRSSDGYILAMNAQGNKWSYIGRDERGQISRVVEKEQISDEATVGIYAWRNLELLSDSVQFLKVNNMRVNNEFYLAPSFDFLIQNGFEVQVNNVGNHGNVVHGLGTPEDLEAFLAHRNFEAFLNKQTQAGE